MHFDFTDLRLFVAVAEAGSITAGADRACLSLASASARIRGLEQQAGVQLLARGARGVQTTLAGERLLGHARLLLQQSERLRGDMAEFSPGSACHLRILANTVAASTFLPELLADYLLLHPQTDIVLEELPSTAISQSILDQTADIGIVANHADLRGLESYPFRQDRLVLALPADHPLAGRASVSFSETLAYDFIGLSDDSALQQHLAQHAVRSGSPMRLRARAGSFEVVCRMVTRGAGIAVVPEEIARQRPGMQVRIIALDDA
ncbi:LysR substrate-binding domain-containing protein [Serratia proteamaculans]|uniref:LysR substrate-binding domain-containing protein n=1 Tax=Serratia proteamaculans TaxID=28151 RepID=UPI0021792731|nr:LysR substrate-binding domain-containing protein [Serratia proteamaculans]CAI1635380.1 CysJI operon transcriptional activator [Serratia proteamaculans]